MVGYAQVLQIIFQYSCHIVDAGQNLTHKEYLHTDKTDPRHTLVKSLIDTLQDTGTIVAYNAGFEKGIIAKLATVLPQYSKELDAINERFWDQLNIFRRHYSDYRFKGSNGLKSVLPIVVPGMGYFNLDVKEGSQAQVVWKQMIDLPNGHEKNILIQQLLKYCRLDTLAMVEIHRMLMK